MVSDTQLASMRLGSVASAMDDERRRRKREDVVIHIADGQTDEILDTITERHTLDNVHRKSLEDTLETFDFTALGEQRYAQYLEKRNRVIISDEDGSLIEFIIHESDKRHDHNGLIIDVYTVASYLDLQKARVIQPQSLTGYTPNQAVNFALLGTEWQLGTVEVTGVRTFHIDTHTNPYALLKRIAREFEAEIHFRVEHDGQRITGRYVDLLQRVGEWRGREVVFGRDLIGIRRIEKTDQIVTALVGLGPEREDGARLQVFVEDEDALQRWGRRHPQTGQLMHLIEVYEPQSERTEMTQSELEQYTRTELNKRINAVVTYDTEIADLEHVPGLENKQIRFGDTIRIKDESFSPALYLDARVFEQERNIFDPSRKRVKLGDYTEYTEEEVKAIWKALQQEIAKKVSMAQVMQVTYDKETIDQKDQLVYQDSTYYADIQAQPGKEAKQKIDTDVGTGTIETTSGAQQKADQAENNAKSYADQKIAEAQLEIEEAKQRLDQAEQDIATAQQNIIAVESWLSDLDQELSELDMQKISDGVFALEGGTLYLEGQIITRAGGVFDGNIIARNLTLTNNITAQNAVITGTIIGSGATFQNVDIEQANIINANIQDATISGTLVGVDGTFTGDIITSQDAYIGNNIFLGDPEDYASPKRLQFNNDSWIGSNENGLTIQGPGQVIISAAGSYGDLNLFSGGEIRIEAHTTVKIPFFETHIIYGMHNGTSMVRDHLNGNVTVNAQGNTLFLGYDTTVTVQVQRPFIVQGRGEIRYDQDRYFRIRGNAGSHENSIVFDRENNTISIYQNGAFRHAFLPDGTKTGGSVEHENKVYGMSPIDSPQVVLTSFMFNQDIDGEKAFELDDVFSAVISDYDVISTNPEIRTEKIDERSFKAVGHGKTSFIIFGLRKGYEEVYWMSIAEVNRDEGGNEIEH